MNERQTSQINEQFKVPLVTIQTQELLIGRIGPVQWDHTSNLCCCTTNIDFSGSWWRHRFQNQLQIYVQQELLKLKSSLPIKIYNVIILIVFINVMVLLGMLTLFSTGIMVLYFDLEPPELYIKIIQFYGYFTIFGSIIGYFISIKMLKIIYRAIEQLNQKFTHQRLKIRLKPLRKHLFSTLQNVKYLEVYMKLQNDNMN